MIGKTNFENEEEILEYMSISKDKELYLALANHGTDSKPSCI
ncbi:hypothetical protein [Clostridium sp. Marseille-Q7071]